MPLPQSTFRALLSRYSRFLSSHPYQSQMITGGALWLAGDLLSQTFGGGEHGGKHGGSGEHGGSGKHTSEYGTRSSGNTVSAVRPTASSSSSSPSSSSSTSIDWKRAGIMTAFGVCVAGPAYAMWYSLLDRELTKRMFVAKINKAARLDDTHLTPHFLKWKMTLAKVIADIVLFDPPFLATFFFTTHLLTGHTLSQTWRKMKQDVVPTYWIDIQVWTPMQIINFRFVPVAWQPVFVNIGNVGWNAYLSYVQNQEVHSDTEAGGSTSATPSTSVAGDHRR